jgi:hypothetical protein
MTKRILIASSNPWSLAVAVEQEIARSNSSASVDMIDLFTLSASHSPHWRRRDVLIERMNRKIERFVKPSINGRDITGEVELAPRSIPPVPQDTSTLRGYRVGNARVGLAVLSSVTSLTTVQEPGSREEYGEALPRAWRSAHLSAQAAEWVRPLGYDEIYIFNGRHCYSRPFCDVLEETSRVFRYEQGGAANSFVMTDAPIHLPETATQLILAHDYDPAAGEAFYLDRLRKAPGDAVNYYTSAQVEGLLPAGVEPGQFVAFFTSSSDEFTAISDSRLFGDFHNQFEAAVAIAREAAKQGRTFVLRMHPHLRYKHESWRREWDFDALEALGALIIQPDDKVDSYALAAASRCVFTCGSTVGFECSFRNIPNADIGTWAGFMLGAMDRVMSAEDVARFIAAPALPPGAREGALRYGSYVRRAGRPLPRLDMGRHPHHSRLDGRIVDPVRHAFQRARETIRRDRGSQMRHGKIVLDPTIEALASKEREQR